MKTGRSLTDMCAEIERQAKAKKDYLAPKERLSMDDHAVLQGVNGGMAMKPIAHAQMAATLGIPKVYYDKMLAEKPDLLARNVNDWLKMQPNKMLVRTLDNQVRALLSDSYRPLDNLDLAEAVLPKLIDIGAQVESCEVTENRFYLKAFTDRVQGAVKVGDVIQAGVLVSNSEVGQGALSISSMGKRLVCLNGMVHDVAVRKAHLGRSSRDVHGLQIEAQEFFRTETRIADDRAFFMKVQDAVAAMFDPKRFEERLDSFRRAEGQVISRTVEEVVDVTSERYGLDKAERSGVLQWLIKGNDMSQWGLANAVTRASQDVDSYDRATELEALGGKIVELPASEWAKLAKVSG